MNHAPFLAMIGPIDSDTAGFLAQIDLEADWIPKRKAAFDFYTDLLKTLFNVLRTGQGYV